MICFLFNNLLVFNNLQFTRWKSFLGFVVGMDPCWKLCFWQLDLGSLSGFLCCRLEFGWRRSWWYPNSAIIYPFQVMIPNLQYYYLRYPLSYSDSSSTNQNLPDSSLSYLLTHLLLQHYRWTRLLHSRCWSFPHLHCLASAHGFPGVVALKFPLFAAWIPLDQPCQWLRF